MIKKSPKSIARSRAVSEKSIRAWNHNGLLGGTYMTKRIMYNITQQPSTTSETKQLAARIELLCGDLLVLLKERVDK